jgi:dipeptidyl aminopeptidase/acylaminoacyl peptidase
LRTTNQAAGVPAALGAALLALSVAYFQMSPPDAAPRTARRFSFSHEGLGYASISPDGRYIAFMARAEDGGFSLWLRSLDSETARELPGIQGAVQYISSWSLDSRSILFGTGDQLKRVAIDGGEPAVHCGLPINYGFPFIGAAYSLDGERIVFSFGLRLWEIPARGGDPDSLFEMDRDTGSYYWLPHFLPKDDGGRYLIYTASSAGARRTALFDSETGEHRVIAPGQNGVYAPSGYVIHGGRDASSFGLFTMPFSLETRLSCHRKGHWSSRTDPG